MSQEETEQVLELRGRLDRARQKVADYRAQVKAADDQLAAADDTIKNLGLDPERDLERQKNRLLEEANKLLVSVEEQLNEVESIVRPAAS